MKNAHWRDMLRRGIALPPIAGGANDIDPAYVPEIWARNALIWLRENTVMAPLVYRDFENEFQRVGAVINLRRPMTFTAAKITTLPITPTDLTPDDDKITLSEWAHVTFGLDDKDASIALESGDPEIVSAVITEHIGPAAAALAKQVDQDLLALYDDLTTSVGTTGSDIDTSVVVAANTALDDQLAPPETRYMVISSKDKGALLSEAEFTSAQWDPGNTVALRNGILGHKFGFDIYMSQLIDNGGALATPVATQNLAFHRNAFALVVRPLRAAAVGAGSMVRTVTDPQSGLAIRLELQRDMLSKAVNCSLDVLYGVKTLDTRLAVQVKS